MKHKHVLVTFIMVTVLIATSSSSVFAQGKTVPIDTNLDYHTIMDNMKNFTLDRIATGIAKQILHQMTQSVVNWINSGFNGSPAFLTNPTGYFLDIGDQITGQFIDSSGYLAGLCSPFGLDVRLNLASSQANINNYRRRYTCTLNTIIQNVQQGAEVGLTVGTSRNGTTISDMMNGNILRSSNQLNVNGTSASGYARAGDSAVSAFMEGDFAKGGWPTFIAMVTEPQNNYYGASYLAQDDLKQRIAEKQEAVNKDLDRGGGFLSWQECESLGTSDTGGEYSNDPSVTEKISGDGVEYQRCKTSTPGSIISGATQKSLGAGQDILVQADDINAVINALMTQLITAALDGGLNSVSRGGNSSYVNRAAKSAKPKLLSSQTLGVSIENITASIDTYDQAIGIASSTRADYVEVRSCFVNALSNPSLTITQQDFAKTNIFTLNQIIVENIDSTIMTLQANKDSAVRSLARARALTATSALEFTEVIPNDAASAQEMIDRQNAYVQSVQNVVSNSSGLSADQDLKDVTKFASQSKSEIRKYRDNCNRVAVTL